MYHPEGIACPSPCNRATNFTFLWKGWVITRWKKNLLIPEAIFFRGGGGPPQVFCGSFQPSPLLKFRSTPLPPRISNLIYKYTSISSFLGIRVPCGTKFLREFTFFRIGDFLCSVRELIFVIRTDWFFLLGVIFLRFSESSQYYGVRTLCK